jgi:hypothetical protein
MFTLAEINAAAPPNSPVKQASGAYWLSVLYAAERKVKDICRRALESASYSDVGYTLPVENTDGSYAYVYYLREPTGSVIAFADLTAFTLNDDTVLTADVTRETTRLVFNSPGEVKVTYPGGYMHDTAAGGAKDVLLGAVIAAMHVIHRRNQGETADFEGIVDTLRPYTACLYEPPYAEGPA